MLCAGILVARRGALRAAAAAPRPRPLAAVPLVLLAVGLQAWGLYVGALDLVLLSIVPFALGGCLAVVGPALARPALPALVVLLFAVPLPGVVGNQLIDSLQHLTVAASAGVLRVLGMPVVEEGMTLRVPSKTVMVIESCSGLASMWMLSMLAVSYVGFFRPRRGHALVLLVAAPLIAFAINILRVVVVAFDPNAGDIEAHTAQGLVAFAVAVALLTGLDVGLGRRWPRTPPGPLRPAAAPRSLPAAPLAALAGAATLMAATQLFAPRYEPVHPGFALPAYPRIGPWRVEPEELAPRSLESVVYTSSTRLDYRRGDERVTVFVAYDDRLDRRRSGVSPKNARTGEDLALLERDVVFDERSGVWRERILERTGTRRMLSYSGYGGLRAFPEEALRAALALDQSPLRRPRGARLLRVSTEVAPGPEGLAAAEARVRELFDFFAPRLQAKVDDFALRGKPPGKIIGGSLPIPVRSG